MDVTVDTSVGGKLHGICGEVEDLDGDSPTHRICHTCIRNRSLSNPTKRKQGQGFVLPCASKNKSGAKEPRELEEQEEVVNALAADTEAVLMEKMNDKFTEDSDSDEKKTRARKHGRG